MGRPPPLSPLRAFEAAARHLGITQAAEERAYTTFAMRWLLPRPTAFHTAHPGAEVLLTAALEGTG